MTTNCGPYTCGDTGCRTMCTQASDCAEGYTCENAACVMVVADAGTDAAVEDVVDASADVVTYLVVYGPRGAGKSTAVQHCLRVRPGVVYVSVSDETGPSLARAVLSKAQYCTR